MRRTLLAETPESEQPNLRYRAEVNERITVIGTKEEQLFSTVDNIIISI